MDKESRFRVLAILIVLLVAYWGYSFAANIWGGVIGALLGAAFAKWVVMPLKGE